MRRLALLILLLLPAAPLEAQIQPVYLPDASLATALANSNNYYPFGHMKMHYQQLYDKQDMGGANLFRFMQLRSSGSSYAGPNYGGFMIEMEMSVGETPVQWSSATNTWATNNPKPIPVISRQWVLMPILLDANPTSWYITLPFEKPVPYTGQNHFCFEVIVYANSRNRTGSYQLDFASGGTTRATRVYETSNITGPTASSLSKNQGLAIRLGTMAASVPIMRFYGTACPGSQQNPLHYVCRELPHLGGQLTMGVAAALPQAPMLLTVGNRNNQWGPFTLPFDMSGVGAPGCFLNASVVLALSTQADGSGNASQSLTVPSNQALQGASLYMQWYGVDVKANALGLVTSRGVEALVE